MPVLAGWRSHSPAVSVGVSSKSASTGSSSRGKPAPRSIGRDGPTTDNAAGLATGENEDARVRGHRTSRKINAGPRISYGVTGRAHPRKPKSRAARRSDGRSYRRRRRDALRRISGPRPPPGIGPASVTPRVSPSGACRRSQASQKDAPLRAPGDRSTQAKESVRATLGSMRISAPLKLPLSLSGGAQS